MLKEFKAFALQGNMLDLAVGLIMGAAFGAVVGSLVNDVVMPPIGYLLGGADFKDLFVSLSGQRYPGLAAAKAAGAPTLNYGAFLNTAINFLVIAFVIFLLVRQVNRLRAKPKTTDKACPYCLSSVPLAATRCGHCTSELKAA